MNNSGYQLSFNTLYLVIPVIRLQQTVFSYPAGQCFIPARKNAINDRRLPASDCTRMQYDQYITALLSMLALALFKTSPIYE